MLMMISVSWIDVIEEKNSGGGKMAVRSAGVYIFRLRRFWNSSALDRSPGEPEKRIEQNPFNQQQALLQSLSDQCTQSLSRCSAHLARHLFHAVSNSQHSPFTHISRYRRSCSASRLANSSDESFQSAKRNVPLNAR